MLSRYSSHGRGWRRTYFADWQGERVVHLLLTLEDGMGWIAHHFSGKYCAVVSDETAGDVLAFRTWRHLANKDGLPPVDHCGPGFLSGRNGGHSLM